MKKRLLTILFASGLLALVSCICKDIKPFWNITDYQIVPLNQDLTQPPTDTIRTLELVLRIDLNVEFLSSWAPHLPVSNCLATSCEDPGYEGMKDQLTSLTVTSNALFNGKPIGSSLNDIAHFYGQTPVSDWVALLGVREPDLYTPLYLYLTEKPLDNHTHQFTITTTFESGATISQSSPTVVWE